MAQSVPLKVNIFVWRLFSNKLATKDNPRRRRVIETSQASCLALCGCMENKNNLFFKCDYYGRLWLLISDWLGIGTVSQGDVISHSTTLEFFEVFQETLGQRLPLFEFRFYLLFGKTVTRGFSTIRPTCGAY